MTPQFELQTFQGMILALQYYWSQQGCAIIQPFDIEVGAGTFHPATFLRAIGPKPWNVGYVQPSRRPTDGRYGENPNRLQHYYQFQVILKPSPLDIQDKYLASLSAVGIHTNENDIRFVEDNWESPTLGAWGLGWEVWMNGMEVTQFTYFQQVGGIACQPVTGEITYGLERLAMYIQQKENVYDLIWCHTLNGPVTYGDVFLENERQMSTYHFERANTQMLKKHFNDYRLACEELLQEEQALPLAAYEMVLKASHAFNVLDARKALSVTERQAHLLQVRQLACAVAKQYAQSQDGE